MISAPWIFLFQFTRFYRKWFLRGSNVIGLVQKMVFLRQREKSSVFFRSKPDRYIISKKTLFRNSFFQNIDDGSIPLFMIQFVQKRQEKLSRQPSINFSKVIFYAWGRLFKMLNLWRKKNSNNLIFKSIVYPRPWQSYKQ